MKSVVFGGAMVDSIALIDDQRIERISMRNAESSYLLLEEGRKTEAIEISQHCGGGAVNVSVAMTRLGLDVSAVIKLGKDHRAEMILRRLADEGVSTRWVMRDERSATGAAVMIASHERDAAIFTYRGANTLLTREELRPDMFSADLIYIAGLSNESADCFPEIVAQAKRSGATVATNPGVRQLASRSAPFHAALADIDILSINRTEADVLVPQLAGRFGEGGHGLPNTESEPSPELLIRGLRSAGHEMSLAHFMAALHACGVGHVVITNGADGAYLSDGSHIIYCAARRVEIAGTAGGGDAFAATFTAWLSLGFDGVDALKAATLNSASVIGHADTQTGLLRKTDLEREISNAGSELVTCKWPIGT